MDFSKLDGLIPAVIQDVDSAEVLMVGFMNDEAFQLTKSTGFATFFSRTRNKLWMKGETSGNRLQVVELLKERDVTLEVNPWSNYLTNSVATIEEHPLKKLFDLGVKVTINSDDPEVLETNLNNEYRIAHEILGMSLQDIATCNRYACEASFIPGAAKNRIGEKYFA